MANHKSSEKRARQSKKRANLRKNNANAVKSFEKKVIDAIAKKDPAAAKLLKEYSSKVTKAAQKGYLHVKKASRRISRLSSQVSKAVSK